MLALRICVEDHSQIPPLYILDLKVCDWMIDFFVCLRWVCCSSYLKLGWLQKLIGCGCENYYFLRVSINYFQELMKFVLTDRLMHTNVQADSGLMENIQSQHSATALLTNNCLDLRFTLCPFRRLCQGFATWDSVTSCALKLWQKITWDKQFVCYNTHNVKG